MSPITRYNAFAVCIDEQLEKVEKIEVDIGRALDYGKWTSLQYLQERRMNYYAEIGRCYAEMKKLKSEHPQLQELPI